MRSTHLTCMVTSLQTHLLCWQHGKELPPQDVGQGRLQGLLRWTFRPEQLPPRWWNTGKVHLKIISRIYPLCWAYDEKGMDCMICMGRTQRNQFWTSPGVHHSTWAVKKRENCEIKMLRNYDIRCRQRAKTNDACIVRYGFACKINYLQLPTRLSEKCTDN